MKLCVVLNGGSPVLAKVDVMNRQARQYGFPIIVEVRYHPVTDWFCAAVWR